jgi:hypothetical protein
MTTPILTDRVAVPMYGARRKPPSPSIPLQRIVDAIRAGHTTSTAIADYIGCDRQLMSVRCNGLTKRGLLKRVGRVRLPGSSKDSFVYAVAAGVL